MRASRVLERLVGRRLDHAAVDGAQLPAGDPHDTETRVRHARVYAHDEDHAYGFCARGRMPSRGPSPRERPLGGGLLEQLLRDVEVRVHGLDVVVVVEGLHQPDQRPRLRLRLRPRRPTSAPSSAPRTRPRRRSPRARLADRRQGGGLGGHLEQVAVGGHVLGAGIDRGEQVLLAVAVGVDDDHALLLELPGDRARLAEAAAVLVEGVAHLRAGAVAVVGQRLDQDRRAARAVALIDDTLDLLVAARGPGAAVDRPLDVVLGHRVAARLLDRRGEGEVRVGVSPALTGGDRDRARELREQLPALGVGGRLLVLDRSPFRVSGHAPESRPTRRRRRPRPDP